MDSYVDSEKDHYAGTALVWQLGRLGWFELSRDVLALAKQESLALKQLITANWDNWHGFELSLRETRYWRQVENILKVFTCFARTYCTSYETCQSPFQHLAQDVSRRSRERVIDCWILTLLWDWSIDQFGVVILSAIYIRIHVHLKKRSQHQTGQSTNPTTMLKSAVDNPLLWPS